jgi:APA family basic amino acid/polyamine antiporter
MARRHVRQVLQQSSLPASSALMHIGSILNLNFGLEDIMATPNTSTGELKPTLGLTGITINAMALIAPGAFLWTTFQEQTAFGASSMWASVCVATIVALLTASCYAVFAKRYPQAGAGSSYYYAEQAFLEKEKHDHFKLARVAKLIVGIAAHLYYWVYPGVMVAFMGTLLVFIGQLFNPSFASAPMDQVAICVIFAAIVGGIAYLGVNGSTMVNILINIIQITSLIVLSVSAIMYRLGHPGVHYEQSSALSVIMPHGLTQLLFQSTIAILLVVGFESATALAAEAKDPLKDIPRGVILSLIIQAVIFYLFEYFAANFFIGDQYAAALDKNGANFELIDPSKIHSVTQLGATYAGGSIVTGYTAATSDGAPIGSFANIIGNSLFNGHGFAFELILAITVFLALIGTTLSCLNTAVRVSYAMGKDDELPGMFGVLHGKFNTPHLGVITLTLLSAIIGGYGVLDADNLVKISLISNIGTFLLYGLTCLATFIAFSTIAEGNAITTKLIPVLGVILNFGLMFFDFYFAFNAPSASANSRYDTKCALAVSVGFVVLSFLWLVIRSASKKQPMFLPPDHRDTMATGSV